jgi:hypothetical protein
VPVNTDVPSLEAILIDEDDSHVNALGIKGVGGRSRPGRRGRGRPENFDRSVALQQAMKLVRERGYSGASFDEAAVAIKLGNHSYRVTGITTCLRKGSTLEKAAAWLTTP